MLRDRLLARLAEMGDAPDHQRLAAEVLGIRGAPPELARRLVAQALVLEDRREVWRRTGERICRDAPATPGVYVLKDADGRALYVGKAVNLRRRLRAHFAERRWRAIKPEMSRAADAEWQEVGSELEALLREAALIQELQPPVNVQTGGARLDARATFRARSCATSSSLVPSVEADSVELVGARRRRPVDDPAHAPQRRRPRRPHAAPDALLPRPAPRRATRSTRARADRVLVAARPRRGGDAARSARRPRRARAARAAGRAARATSGCSTSGLISVSRVRDGA